MSRRSRGDNQSQKPAKKKISALAILVVVLVFAVVFALSLMALNQAINQAETVSGAENSASSASAESSVSQPEPTPEGQQPDLSGKAAAEENGRLTRQLRDDYLSSCTIEETLEWDASKQLAEAEAVAEFASRGFTNVTVTTTFSAQGEFIDITEVSASGTAKHPEYRALYAAEGGEAWSLVLVGEILSATCLTYQPSSGQVPPIVSEEETIGYYVPDTTTLYKIIPPTDRYRVIKTPSITAEVLNATTADKLREA